MVQLLPEQQNSFTRLLRTKGQSVDAGIVAASHAERKRYWNHWKQFIAPFHDVDPLLTNIRTSDRIELITAFAEYIHTGACGQGNRVCAGTIQVAVCAIGKTFELDGRPNPLYHTEGRYWLQLE